MFLSAGLTLFAIAVNGYHPYADDGGLYVAGIKRLLDPTLYQRSAGFVLEHTQFSVFAPAVAELVRLTHLELPAVLLLLHALTIWATLFATWMLAERCWPTWKARAGAVLLTGCCLALPVAGTALVIMDPYLTARSFSTPCTLLALVGALDATAESGGSRRRRGLLLWFGSLAVAIAMHPLMGAYALAATAVLACVRLKQGRICSWANSALFIAAVATAAILQAISGPETPDYVRAALTRTYWFPTEWKWYELFGLAAPLLILAQLARERRVPSKQRNEYATALARAAVVLGGIAVAVSLLFARTGGASHLVARLQPLRTFQVVYLVMLMMLGAKFGEFVLRRSAWRWCATATLLGTVMFCVAQQTFPNSNHLELPGVTPRNAWVRAFLWIRSNTPKDALFALDPDYINAPGEDAQCFRAIAERSGLPDYSKDGGEAAITPSLATAWTAGQRAQSTLILTTQGDVQQADAVRRMSLQPFGVSWLVMPSGTKTHMDCPYDNGAAKVCRLR